MEQEADPLALRPPGGVSPYAGQETCDRLIALALENKTPAEWMRALGIADRTCRKWRAEHPEFSDAWDTARLYFRAYLESEARAGIRAGRTMNVACIQLLGRLHFRDDFSERTVTDATVRNVNEPAPATPESMADDELVDRLAQIRAEIAARKAAIAAAPPLPE